MFKNKLFMLNVCILIFILSFSLLSGVYADNFINNEDNSNVKSLLSAQSVIFDNPNNLNDYDGVNSDNYFYAYAYGDDDEDEDYDTDEDEDYDTDEDEDYDTDEDEDYDTDEDEDYDTDEDEDYDGDGDDEDDSPNYYEWIWKGETYYISLDEFSLTDEELTELFTKRDKLMEEIENLQSKIYEMDLSRNQDLILIIDELYNSINIISNNTEFNELLLNLKNISLNDTKSTFNELKILLGSIKEDYPTENFTKIDDLISTIELMLNEEYLKYENLTQELAEKLEELYELFDEYPFLIQNTKYAAVDKTLGAYAKFEKVSYTSNNNTLAEMKTTGLPHFQLVLLVLLLSLLGANIRRKP
ncbi:hypothetical protein [Methanobrevibacter curvatus]|uniref:Uncharacterized protein n=1 Tax=Methanobrevibacter curvatus TaxID=49547 RepID=A0A166AIR4_9EURY|nr:hypothetical protein [Methanobrevibacter curvatus]KZX12082.1 hypothetical protein MBCUR_11850 [Methanobrevibacter curvatus]